MVGFSYSEVILQNHLPLFFKAASKNLKWRCFVVNTALQLCMDGNCRSNTCNDFPFITHLMILRYFQSIFLPGKN